MYVLVHILPSGSDGRGHYRLCRIRHVGVVDHLCKYVRNSPVVLGHILQSRLLQDDQAPQLRVQEDQEIDAGSVSHYACNNMYYPVLPSLRLHNRAKIPNLYESEG